LIASRRLFLGDFQVLRDVARFASTALQHHAEALAGCPDDGSRLCHLAGWLRREVLGRLLREVLVSLHGVPADQAANLQLEWLGSNTSFMDGLLRVEASFSSKRQSGMPHLDSVARPHSQGVQPPQIRHGTLTWSNSVGWTETLAENLRHAPDSCNGQALQQSEYQALTTASYLQGSWLHSEGGDVQIQLQGDTLFIQNPHASSCRLIIKEHIRGNELKYYGLTGTIRIDSATSRISWTNGVVWKKETALKTEPDPDCTPSLHSVSGKALAPRRIVRVKRTLSAAQSAIQSSSPQDTVACKVLSASASSGSKVLSSASEGMPSAANVADVFVFSGGPEPTQMPQATDTGSLRIMTHC